MLLALCGGLVHYLNNVAPGVISSDRRLKEAANAVIAHLHVEDGKVTLDTSASITPSLPASDSVLFALRDPQGRLIDGDPRVPAVQMPGDVGQIVAVVQIQHHNVRSLTTRFDGAGGVLLITTADVRSVAEPTARYGLMSTLLWDFVQLDITLVLVWVSACVKKSPRAHLRTCAPLTRPRYRARSPLRWSP